MKQKVLTVSYVQPHDIQLPFIRMQGAYLQKAGFEYRDKILVQVIEPGVLLIKKINKKETVESKGVIE